MFHPDHPPAGPVWKRRVSFLYLIACAAAGVLSLAGSGPRLTLERLAERAELIVQGRVLEVRSEGSDPAALTTRIVVAVEEQWKGPRRSTVVIEQPEGSAGGIAKRVPGLARFAAGEEAILFLGGEAGGYAVVGGAQGKFLLETGSQSGPAMVQDPGGNRQPRADFVRRLKNILGAKRSPSP